MLGWVSAAGERMNELGADALVVPSLSEGLPTVILEAGRSRIPVVATDIGGIPEIITDQVNGLIVEPGNPQAIAAAVSRLAEDPALAEKLSNNLHRTLLERFSLAKMVAGWQRLYAHGGSIK